MYLILRLFPVGCCLAAFRCLVHKTLFRQRNSLHPTDMAAVTATAAATVTATATAAAEVAAAVEGTTTTTRTMTASKVHVMKNLH